MNIDNPGALAGPQASLRREQESTSMGRDDFMQLLVAQLQNQDPLEPMDSEQMVTQLSQLTSVEELVAIEGRMQALEIGISSVNNTQVSGLVGKTITADGSQLNLRADGGVGSAIELDAPASEVTVTIRNAAGEAVRTLELGAAPAGPLAFDWDGLDASGNRMPEGRYRVEVDAKNENGQPVGASMDVSGLVSSVDYEGGFPELVIGERRVLLGDVRSIAL
ncbi:MAG: FlgD immunoglobulin-like domain containing protein [Myxococcota bacterium]